MRVLATFLAITYLVVASDASAQTTAPVRDPARQIQVRPITWKDYRDRNIVKQQRDFSCGAAALATIGKYYWGDDLTEQQVLTVIENNLTDELLKERIENGLAISDLRLAAVELGYLSTIGRLDLEKIRRAKVPLIVALRLKEFDHFVVVRGFSDGWVYLADPSRGNIRIPVQKFEKQWIENAVLVVVKKGKTQSDETKLNITDDERTKGWLNNQVIRTFPQKVW